MNHITVYRQILQCLDFSDIHKSFSELCKLCLFLMTFILILRPETRKVNKHAYKSDISVISKMR